MSDSRYLLVIAALALAAAMLIVGLSLYNLGVADAAEWCVG